MEIDRSLSPGQRDVILAEACGRNLPAEVVLAGTDDNAPLRSRLLQAAGTLLVIEVPTREGTRVMLHEGDRLNVVFMFGGQKFGFSSTVRERSKLKLGESVEVATLVLGRPQKVLKMQRRRFFRVTLPPTKPLVVQCAAHDAKAEAAGGDGLVRFETIAYDLSSGGIAIRIPRAYLPLAAPGRRIALVFDLEGVRRTLRLIGEVRHLARKPSGDNVAGMQFVEWQKTLAGRKAVNAITRFVVKRQRDELRKKSGLE